MSDFIGRTAELQRLDQLYAARKSAFVRSTGGAASARAS
jgi:hypothetical protein